MDPDTRRARESLLRRAVLAGDEDAWRGLYLENFDPLANFARWRCGGRRDEADEVVQETWLIAVRQIRAFNPHQGSFLTWLRGIAANVRRNHLRHAIRLQRRETSSSAAEFDAPQIDSRSTEAEERERGERIAAALDALPERQEAVLRAKYLDELSVAQIAASWKETPKAIESLLTRAREAFRMQFEKLPEKVD